MVETTPVRLRILLTPGLIVALAATTSSAGVAGRTDDEASGRLVAARDFHVHDTQLARLIDGLLQHNPEARAARESSLARREQVLQARSLPDPRLTLRRFVSTPETRVGPQDRALEISQTLPWFGKRELQADRAAHLATSASWRARELERTLVAELKRTYFEAAFLQEALAINADEAALLGRFEQIALTRYSTGEGIQQSVVKVQTDVTRLADRRTALEQRLAVAERRIAELVGRPETALVLSPIRLDPPVGRFDRETLEADAIAGSPAILATEHQVEADESWIRRRHRDSYPDFSVGLGYIDVGRRDDTAGMANPPQDNGKDVWAVSLMLNIPLWRDRIRAGIAEAEHGLLSSRQAVQRTRDRLRFGVQEALLRLESLDERARLYREVLVPQAEEALASAEAAYTTNRLGFLDLLDAERVLFQIRLTYHRLVADAWIALADLERAVARPVPARAVNEEPRPQGSLPEEGP